MWGGRATNARVPSRERERVRDHFYFDIFHLASGRQTSVEQQQHTCVLCANANALSVRFPPHTHTTGHTQTHIHKNQLDIHACRYTASPPYRYTASSAVGVKCTHTAAAASRNNYRSSVGCGHSFRGGTRHMSWVVGRTNERTAGGGRRSWRRSLDAKLAFAHWRRRWTE